MGRVVPVTAGVVRDTVVAVRVMHHPFRLMNRVARVNTRVTRAVVRDTVVEVRVMHHPFRLMNRVARVNTKATRAVVRVTAAAGRVVEVRRRTIARAGVSEAGRAPSGLTSNPAQAAGCAGPCRQQSGSIPVGKLPDVLLCGHFMLALL